MVYKLTLFHCTWSHHWPVNRMEWNILYFVRFAITGINWSYIELCKKEEVWPAVAVVWMLRCLGLGARRSHRAWRKLFRWPLRGSSPLRSTGLCRPDDKDDYDYDNNNEDDDGKDLPLLCVLLCLLLLFKLPHCLWRLRIWILVVVIILMKRAVF